MRRYPLAPLMDAARVDTMKELRAIFPMNGTEYRRVLDDGLSESQADRWSVRLGLVAWEVWPDWLDDVSVPCGNERCDRRFVPKRRNHLYCSERCSRRVQDRRYQRRKYAADAEYRERKVERNKAYRAEVAAYRLEWQRRYYRENRDELLAKKAAYRDANREAINERQRLRRRSAA